MNGSIIGNLADFLRVEVANKQLQRGPDLAWAERIIAEKAAGAKVGFHAYKLASKALAERGRQPKS